MKLSRLLRALRPRRRQADRSSEQVNLSVESLEARQLLAVIAYDGFDYAVGDVTGASGGVGWTTAWNTTTDARVDTDVVNRSLSYVNGEIAIDGGDTALQIRANATFGGQVVENAVSRELAEQSGDIWVGYLFQPSTGVGNNEFFQLGLDQTATNPRVSSVHMRSSGGDMRLYTRIGGSTNSDTSGLTPATTESYFVVFHIYKDSSSIYNKVDAYLNPTSLANPGTAVATVTSDSQMSVVDTFINRLARFDANDTYHIDELRIGTTYRDVVGMAIWDGNSDGDGDGVNWADANNWVDGYAPTASSNVFFTGLDAGQVDVPAGVSVRSLNFSNNVGQGYTFVGGGLTIGYLNQSGTAENIIQSQLTGNNLDATVDAGQLTLTNLTNTFTGTSEFTVNAGAALETLGNALTGSELTLNDGEFIVSAVPAPNQLSVAWYDNSLNQLPRTQVGGPLDQMGNGRQGGLFALEQRGNGTTSGPLSYANLAAFQALATGNGTNSVPGDDFAFLWTGTFTPTISGNYYWGLGATLPGTEDNLDDEGVVLIDINGDGLFDNATERFVSSLTADCCDEILGSTAAVLTAGQQYRVAFAFAEYGGGEVGSIDFRIDGDATFGSFTAVNPNAANQSGWWNVLGTVDLTGIDITANGTSTITAGSDVELGDLTLGANATLVLDGTSQVGFTTVALTGTASTFQTGDGNEFILRNVSGNSSLEATGTGRVRLATDNSFTGATNVGSSATLIVSANGALGGTTTVTSGGSLVLDRVAYTDTSSPLILNGNGSNTTTQAALRGIGDSSFAGAITLASTSEIQTDGGTLTLSATLSGNGTLEKTGTGSLRVAANNSGSFSGLVDILQGTLIAASTGALGDSANGVQIASGATLALDGGITLTENVLTAGTGIGGNGAILNISGNNTLVGVVTTIDAAGSVVALGSSAGLLRLRAPGGGATDTVIDLKTITNVSVVGAGDVEVAGRITATTTTYASKINALLPTAYWAFDETSGTTAVNSASGANSLGAAADGTINNVTVGAEGISGNAYNWTGTGNVLIDGGATTGSLGFTGSFTAMAWFQRSETGNGDRMIFGNDNNSGSADALRQIHFGLRNSQPHMGFWGDDANGGGAITNTNWNHVAYRFDGTNQEIFVNGNRVHGDTAAALLISTGILEIGSTNGLEASRVWQGLLDELAVFNRALTAQEIAYIAASATAMPSVNKSGSGRLILSGDNQYTGTTTVQQGTLLARNDNALGTSDVGTTVAAGASLVIDGGRTIDEDIAIAGSGNSASPGALSSINGTNTLLGDVLLTAASAINVGDGSTLLMPGVISGADGVTLSKIGAGTAVFSGVNTYGGQTIIHDGTLVATNTSALGTTTGTTVVDDDATLFLDGTYTLAENLSVGGLGAPGTIGALVAVNGEITITGDIDVNFGAIIGAEAGATLFVGSAVGNGTGDITVGPGNLVVAGDGDTVIRGQITGTAGVTQAVVVDYSAGFPATPTDLTLRGSATVVGSVLNLTPALGNRLGNVWTTHKVSVANGFTSTFRFQFPSPGNGGADGIGFIIQPTGNTVDVNEGGPTSNALTVKFDSYQNGGEPSGSFIDLRAGSTSLATYNLQPGGIDLSGSGPHDVVVNYNATTQTLTVSFNGNVVISHVVDLAAIGAVDSLGNAFVGFSGRTGGAFEEHNVLNWTYVRELPLAGSNFLTKQGNGTLTIASANTYSGDTSVEAGALMVTNTTGSATSNGQLIFADNTTFGGAGTVTESSLQLGANMVITPGNEPGLSGQLTLNGDGFALDAASTVNIDINGNTPGTGYDQLQITAAGSVVNLGGATLNINAPFTVAAGQQIVIVNLVDSSSSLAGGTTFAGLPDGALIDVGGQTFVIRYNAGTNNNDVVLEAAGPNETLVEIDGNGNLVITDVNGGVSADQLTISTDGNDYVISDASLTVATTIAGATRPDVRTVRVARSLVTGDIIVRTLASNDSIHLDGLVTLAGTGVQIDAGAGSDTVHIAAASSIQGDLLSIAETVTQTGSLTVTGAAEFYASSYSNIVTADGAVAYYQFNETSGTAAGATIGDVTGVYQNGVGLGATGAISSSSTNLAADLDGSNDYISFSDAGGFLPASIFSDNTYSIELWFRQDAAASGRSLVAFTDIPGGHGVLLETSGTGGALRYLHRPVSGSGGGHNIYSTTTFTPGQWAHMVAVVDGGTMRLYINGVQNPGTITGVDPIAYAVEAVLGRLAFTNAGRYFNGLIDEFAVYDNALTADQIVAHYAAANATVNITLDNAANDFNSVQVTNGGTVVISDANDLVLGTSSIETSLTVSSPATVTQTGVLSGNGSFTHAGSGTVILSQNNTYAGTTNVIGGPVLTDDFESYGIGDTRSDGANVSGGVWNSTGTTYVEVQDRGSEQFLQFGHDNGTRGGWRMLGSGIADGEHGVVSMDIRTNTANGGDQAYFGVTNVTTLPTSTNQSLTDLYNRYRVMVGLVTSSTSGVVDLVALTNTGVVVLQGGLSANTYYHVDLVIDNASDVYDVILDGVKLNASPLNFRQPVNGALDRFYVVGDGENLGGELDNLVLSQGGTLIVDGTHTGGGNYNVAIGSVLAGNGSITTNSGQLILDGTLSPGNPATAGGIGTLDVGGDLNLNNTFDFDIDGANTDGVIVQGGVTLGAGATLNLNVAGDPTASTIVLIDNDGADPMTGQFVGIANGDVITVGTVDYQLFYNGGDGNDVILVEVVLPTTVYVNDDWGQSGGPNLGQTIDGDLEAPGVQAAIFGVTAFASVQEALDALDPAQSGTIFINAGNYAESITLPGAQSIDVFFVEGDSTLTSLVSDANDTIALGGFDANHSVAVELSLGSGDIASDISGAGGLRLNGGTLSLSGNNTYDGVTRVPSGLLIVESNTALGSTVGETRVAANAAVRLADGVTVTGENATIRGDGGVDTAYRGALQVAANATAEWAGTIVLDETRARIGAQDNGTLTVSGVISDGGNDYILRISGSPGTGTVILAAQNTFTGDLEIIRGILKLGIDNALLSTVIVNINAANINEASVFDLNGFDQTVAGVIRGGTNGSSTVTNTGTSDSTLTFYMTADVEYGGVITDDASDLNIVLTGPSLPVVQGVLTLSGNNSYDGTTTIQSQSMLLITSDTALGTGAGGTRVLDNGRLFVGNNITVADETVTIFGNGSDFLGAIRSVNGTNVWNGDVIIGSDASRIGAVGGSSLEIGGNITDGANSYTLGLRTDGNANSRIIISGSANDYDGFTDVVVGRVQLAGGANRLPVTTVVRIGNDSNTGFATLDLNGQSQEIGGLISQGTTMAQTVTNSGSTDATLTITNNANYSYVGVITNGPSNSLSLIKQGTGTQTLSGTNSYAGTTIIRIGTLALAGTGSINSTSEISVESGAFFDVTGLAGGSYTFGNLVTGAGTVLGVLNLAGGELSPGDGNGTLPGTITIDGGLSLDSNGQYTVGLDSAAVFDSATVLGEVNLNSDSGSGASLDVTFNFTPTANQAFVIVNNDGTDAVVGTFAGLAEGTAFLVGGVTVVITYQYDADTNSITGGNDIALIVPDIQIVEGTDGDDVIHIYNSADGQDVIVAIGGVPVFTFTVAGLNQLVVNAKGGTDQIFIENVSGDDSDGQTQFSLSDGGLVINGGDGLDTLTVSDNVLLNGNATWGEFQANDTESVVLADAGGGLEITTGRFSVDGAVTLQTDVDLMAEVSAVFGSTIDGAADLNIETGTLTLQGDVGSATPLDSLAIDVVNALTLDVAVTTTGNQTIDVQTGGLTVSSSGSLQSLGGGIDLTLDNSLVLSGSIIAEGDMNIAVDTEAADGLGAIVLIQGDLASNGGQATITTGDDADTILYDNNRSGTIDLVINTAAGDDLLGFIGTPQSGTATLNLGDGNDTVTFGTASLSLDLLGLTFNVNGGTGSDTVNVNDQAAATGQQYTQTAGGLSRGNEFSLSHDAVELLNVATSAFDDAVSIAGSEATLESNWSLGAGNDAVVIGENGIVDAVEGLLNIDAGSGDDLLIMDDSANSIDKAASLTSGTLSGLSVGEVNYSLFETLNLLLGTGNDEITLLSTSGSTTTNVNTGLGDDVVALGVDDPALSVRANVSDLGGSDTVSFAGSSAVVFDMDSTAEQVVNARGDALTMLTPFENVIGSMEADTFFIDPLAGTPRSVQGNPPVGVGSPDLNGNFASGDTLFIDGLGSSFALTRELGNGTFTSNAPSGTSVFAPISFESIEILTITQQIDLRGLPIVNLPAGANADDVELFRIPQDTVIDTNNNSVARGEDDEMFFTRGGTMGASGNEPLVLVVFRILSDGSSVPVASVGGASIAEALEKLGRLELPPGEYELKASAEDVDVVVPLPAVEGEDDPMTPQELNDLEKTIRDELMEAGASLPELEEEMDDMDGDPASAAAATALLAGAALSKLHRRQKQSDVWSAAVERFFSR
jgi:autotransporter-associated beta strand protein